MFRIKAKQAIFIPEQVNRDESSLRPADPKARILKAFAREWLQSAIR